MYAILVAIIISSAFGHPTTPHDKECMKEIHEVYAGLRIPPGEEHNYKAIITEIKKRVNPQICSHVHLKFGIINGKIVVYNPDDANNDGSEETLDGNQGEDFHRNGRRAPPHRHYVINHNNQRPYPDYPNQPNNYNIRRTPYDEPNEQAPTENQPQDGNNDNESSEENPDETNIGNPVEEQNETTIAPTPAIVPDHQLVNDEKVSAPVPVANNIPTPPITKPIEQPEPEKIPENIPNQAPIAPPNANNVPLTYPKINQNTLDQIDKTKRDQEERDKYLQQWKQFASEKLWQYASKFFTPINKCGDGETGCEEESLFTIFCNSVERYFERWFDYITVFVTGGGFTTLITNFFTLGDISSLGGIPSAGGIPSVSNIPSAGGIPSVGGIPSAGGIPSVGGIPSAGEIPSGVSPIGGVPSEVPSGIPSSGAAVAAASAIATGR